MRCLARVILRTHSLELAVYMAKTVVDDRLMETLFNIAFQIFQRGIPMHLLLAKSTNGHYSSQDFQQHFHETTLNTI